MLRLIWFLVVQAPLVEKTENQVRECATSTSPLPHTFPYSPSFVIYCSSASYCLNTLVIGPLSAQSISLTVQYLCLSDLPAQLTIGMSGYMIPTPTQHSHISWWCFCLHCGTQCRLLLALFLHSVCKNFQSPWNSLLCGETLVSPDFLLYIFHPSTPPPPPPPQAGSSSTQLVVGATVGGVIFVVLLVLVVVFVLFIFLKMRGRSEISVYCDQVAIAIIANLWPMCMYT